MSLFWRRRAWRDLDALYAERERLRSMGSPHYAQRAEHERALREVEGEIAVLEALLGIPYRG